MTNRERADQKNVAAKRRDVVLFVFIAAIALYLAITGIINSRRADDADTQAAAIAEQVSKACASAPPEIVIDLKARGLCGKAEDVKRDISQSTKGPKGDQGVPGVRGPQGIPGPQGVRGIMGQQGTTGRDGIPGAMGSLGPQGTTGEKGDTGATGGQGPTGMTGPAGEAGPAGPKGDTGATGPQGDPGPQGPQGPAGEFTCPDGYTEQDVLVKGDGDTTYQMRACVAG